MENIKFSGHDTVALAQKYGTPLYVMSEDIIRKRIEDLKAAFESKHIDYGINYAGKAFTCTAMCKIIASEGISLDTVSKGEIMTAMQAGFPVEKICFHGNNKKEEDLRFAIENKIGTICVDSEDELALLDRLTKEMGVKVNVIFRVSPGVSAHTHELIQTGTEDSKFGLPYVLAEDIILRTKEMEGVECVGLHCHIGSQIVDEEPFVLAADKMLKLYQKLVEDGIGLQSLNLGGGFGIPYKRGDESFDVLKYVPVMIDRIQKICDDGGFAMPKLLVEPGRYIACEAGVTLYTVGTVKEIPGIRTYVDIDGGMNDNPRPALYDAEYEAFICNGKDSEKLSEYTLSGRACETDMLIEKVMLNQPEVGDTLMVTNTGAYNYSMASNYNRYPRPAVVLLSGSRDGVIVERETEEDVLKNDRVPEWLK